MHGYAVVACVVSGLAIAIQDAHSRSFDALLLVVFAGSLYGAAGLRPTQIGVSVACVAMLVGGTYGLLRARAGSPIELFAEYLGTGDVLLLLALALGFAFEPLLLTVVGACVLGGLWYVVDATAARRGIPFATTLLVSSGASFCFQALVP